MKRLWLVLGGGIICIQLAGCAWVVRTTSTVKPRVDQEISGNRGFILGRPSMPPPEPTFTERKVYRIELEIPDWPEEMKPRIKPPTEDKVIWGNRGYIFGGPPKKRPPSAPVKAAKKIPKVRPQVSIKRPKKVLVDESGPEIREEEILPLEPKLKLESKPRTHKVRKGETLQKIAQKFYGTTKKWPLIYEANKDKLKSPDEIFPGQILIIPEVEKVKK